MRSVCSFTWPRGFDSSCVWSHQKRVASAQNRPRAEAWSLLRLLVEADNVAGGVAEPGSDLGGVGAHGLDDFALVGEDGVEGGGHAVAHDVKQKAGLGGGRASEDEGGGGIYDFRLTIYDLRN
jgi:hypothetical protein